MSRLIEGSQVGRTEKPKHELSSGVDVFVPKGRERDYLAKHGIDIRYLPNGAMVAGATRKVPDEATAAIDISFPCAPYFEPEGKRGVSHVMEHIIGYPPLYTARDNEAKFNATTRSRHIILTLSGSAHPAKRDYGVWPVLPVAIDQVTQPLTVSEEALAREKKIVLDELHLKRHGLGLRWEDHTLLTRTIYTPDHPDTLVPGGTEAEIQSLKLSDIEVYHRESFIPQGLRAIVFTEGSPAITRLLLDQFEEKIGLMPDDGRRPKEIDDSVLNQTNPKYQQGGIYAEHTIKPHETAGRQQLQFVWMTQLPDFTTQHYANSTFFSAVHDRLFRKVREAGIAYKTSGISHTIGYDNHVKGLTIDVIKQKDPVNYAKAICSQVLETIASFDEQDFNRINRTVHRREAASPTKVKTRFENALTGLYFYGRVIDADKVRQTDSQITPDHLRRSQEQLLSIPPTIIVEGDLSK